MEDDDSATGTGDIGVMIITDENIEWIQKKRQVISHVVFP
jgi:hypothetical protein